MAPRLFCFIFAFATICTFAATRAIDKYDLDVGVQGIGVHSLVKGSTSGDTAVSDYSLTGSSSSPDNRAPVVVFRELDGYNYTVTCQVSSNAPQVRDVSISASTLIDLGDMICPAYPFKYLGRQCLPIFQFGTVDITLCDWPPAGVYCKLLGHATAIVVEACTQNKRSGGWSIIKGPLLGDGIKVLSLE